MEGNNYGFKFDPNKIEKSFDNGSKLSIENDGGELNMSPDRKYVTANNPNKKESNNNPNKKESNKKLVGVLNKNVTTDDRLGPEVVSPGNTGFASVIGLAALIAVAGVIIAFITLKY